MVGENELAESGEELFELIRAPEDWRAKNLRQLLELLCPLVDFGALHENPAWIQLGRILGYARTRVVPLPEVIEILENRGASIEEAGQMLTRMAKKGTERLASADRRRVLLVGRCGRFLGRALKTHSRQALQWLAEEYHRLEAEVFSVARRQDPWVWQSLLKGYCATFNARGELGINVPVKRRKSLVVRQFLAISGLRIETKFESVPELHQMVARFDQSGEFTKDKDSPNWEIDRKCVEGVCRSIGLKMRDPGRPKNPENE